METIPCNICGSKRNRIILRRSDFLHPRSGYFNIVKCRDCGLAFLNPRPTTLEIGQFYPQGYGSRVQALRGKKKESLYKRIPALIFRDSEVAERLESDLFFSNRKGRILDVGTGGGELLVEFAKRGWDTLGLEPFCEPSSLACEHKVEILPLSFEEARLPEASFDIVLMSHVLEHLHDPMGALRESARVLKRDGLVYIEVPNFDAALRRFLAAKWSALDIPRHLTHFTPKTIKNMARATGFRIAKIRYIANSNVLRESLLRHFTGKKYGGEFPGSSINRILRTPAMKILASLISGFFALAKQSDLIGYYLLKDKDDA